MVFKVGGRDVSDVAAEGLDRLADFGRETDGGEHCKGAGREFDCRMQGLLAQGRGKGVEEVLQV